MTRREFVAGFALKGSVEQLVIEAATGRVLRSGFVPGRREPVGSLVKVFTALAYGSNFPEVICTGRECWKGHGRMDLVNAVAQSCNGYFLQLARGVTQSDVAMVAASYGVAPPVEDTAEARIGLGRGWLETPEALALAYVSLVKRRQEPAAALIVEGLRQCARRGTAKACGAGMLAKTGTSVCMHRPAMPGDGWALGLFPEDLPRYVVVVREHGVPGSTAAARLRGLL